MSERVVCVGKFVSKIVQVCVKELCVKVFCVKEWRTSPAKPTSM